MHKIAIDEHRFKRHFDELTSIGATKAGGSQRLAFSREDSLARQWFEEVVSSSGLTYWTDGAGNQFGSTGDQPTIEKAILLGSHLDTVPDGGRFDGALGVVASIEVCQSVQASGVKCQYPVCVANFSDEEGTHVGLLGSRALTGKLSQSDLDGLSSGTELFETGIKRIGISRKSILDTSCASAPPLASLELHVEQGPVMENSDDQIGIVTSIVGIRMRKVIFHGQSMHAGTTPMNLRKDAGFGACSFAKAARELILEHFPQSVVNVGSIEMIPGSYNVVPSQASVLLEFRAGLNSELDKMESELSLLAQQVASSTYLEVEILEMGNIEPVELNTEIQDVIESSASLMGLKYRKMPSGAGHDTQAIAKICRSGMLFIPSENGVSHSSAEFSSWRDCINGANVLLNSAIILAKNII